MNRSDGGANARAALVAALLWAMPALGQDAPAADQVGVTGTRLPNSDAAGVNPITIIYADDIAKTSAVTAADILAKLPSVDFTGGVAPAQTNGGDGAAAVGLRNLGAQRTLILVDGLRMVGTDTQSGRALVDLNAIPVQMIDHIDVQRDGAASIYGADAIGGVINIVLKKHFTGVGFDSDFGISDKGDAIKYGVSSTIGTVSERGNMLLSASHDHEDPVFQRDRTFSSGEFPGSAVPFPAASPNVPGALAAIGGETVFFGKGGQAFNVANPPANLAGILPPGLVFPGGAGSAPSFDTGAQALLQGELDRDQVAAAGHYDIAPHVTAVLDAFFTHRTSQQQFDPEAIGSNVPTAAFPNGLFVPQFLEGGMAPGGVPNLANPTVAGSFVANGALATGNPQDISNFLTRRFEVGNLLASQDVDTYRLHVGLQGTLVDKFAWEVGYVHGDSQSSLRVANEVDFAHAAEETGQAACNAAAAAAAGLTGPASDPCLANFFGFNSLTPAQARFLAFTGTRATDVAESYEFGDISGPIYQLPAGPLHAVAGVEYRDESDFDQPDTLATSGGGAVQGAYHVGSAYAELSAPILKDRSFAQALTLDASTRFDDYSNFGGALTYKAGLTWQVTDDFRFRASHSTGFRAPQLDELLGGAVVSEVVGADPCDTGGGKVKPSAQCAADLAKAGVGASQIATFSDPTAAIATIQGGNAQLRPERSQEWTLGGGFTPRFVPDLAVTIDYYSVLVRNSIGVANDPLGACESPGAPPSGLADPCAGITRAPGTGQLLSVADPLVNFGAEHTNGIELGLGYEAGLEKLGLPELGGRMLVTGEASYLLSDDLVSGGVATQNAGTFDLARDSAEPRWKALLGATYAKDNWSASLTERYYGGVKPDAASQSPTGCVEPTGFGCHAAGQFFTDLAGGVDLAVFHVTVGIDNLFDREPPFLAGGASVAQTVTGAGYDVVGRFLYSKLSVKW